MFARVCAAALGLVLLVGIIDLIRIPASRAPARLSKLGIVAFGAAAFLALTPNFGYQAIDDLFGVDNAARYVGNSLGLAGAVCAQIMMVYWVKPPERARPAAWLRVAIWAAAVTGMGFAFASTPTAEDSGNWQADNSHLPGIQLYMAFYFAHMTWTAFEIVRYAPKYARKVPRLHIRWALWFFTAAGVGGLAYGLMGLITAGADRLSVPDLPKRLVPIYLTGLAIGMAGLCMSLLIPIIGASIIKSYRAYQCCRLRPFWSALIGTHPEILLESPGKSFTYNLGCIFARQHQALARRTLEIRDAYYQLRDWMDADVAAKAAELATKEKLTGVRHDAAVEAAVLAGALTAKALELPRTGTGGVQPGGDDMPQEVAWLLRVADAFSGPVVKGTVEWLAQRQLAAECEQQ